MPSKNKAVLKAIARRYAQSNKGKATMKRYQQSEKGKIAMTRAKHSEKGKEKERRYWQKVKETGWMIIKKWRIENPERYRMNNCRARHIRRARELGVFSSRIPGDFEKIIKQYGNRCVYCKRSDRKLTQDHIIPITWGGHDAPWNLVPACKSCNCKKGARFWGIAI